MAYTGCTDRHLDIRLQVVERSSLDSVLFRVVFSHPYISFFHLPVNDFSVILIFNFKSFLFQFKRDFSALHVNMLTKFLISSYSAEVHAFDTLITSTKVYRLIICKSH